MDVKTFYGKNVKNVYGKAKRGYKNGAGKISCPVLLIVGEKDRTGKVKSYNKEWAKRTGFPLVWIQNAAHNSNVDNPHMVNSSIMTFLQDFKMNKA